MYLLALLFCKIWKKFLESIKSFEDVPFSGPKLPIFPEKFFFGTNHYYYFHLPIGPFHCAKFKKILTVDPELWGCTIFGPKMVHLPQTNFFLFGKHYLFHFHHFPFPLCKVLKKFSQQIQSYSDVPFLGPKWPICPNENFFRKLFLSFMPIYMPKIKVRY